MIITWLGKSPQISIQVGGAFLPFKYGIPTWINSLAFEQFSKGSGFEVYNGENTGVSTQTFIYVALPSTPGLFIGSLLALKKLIESFPQSIFHIQAPAELSELITFERCLLVRSREKTDYYREYVLTAEANSILNDANALITTPIQQLIMTVAGVLEIDKDRPDNGYIIEFPLGPETLIIEAEIGGFAQLKGLTKAILDTNPEKYVQVSISEDSFEHIFIQIKRAKTVICIGESHFTLIAAALGRRVLIFRKPDASSDFARQYLCYANTEVISATGAASIKDLADRVIDKLNQAPAPEARKWPRVGLDDDGKPTEVKKTHRPQNTQGGPRKGA